MAIKKTRPKNPPTPRSRVRSALRQLWLRSRERNKALKDANYTCERCGRKKSVKKGYEVKITVHHKEGIDNWGKVIEAVYEHLLCSDADLEVLCVECHDAEHASGEDAA